MNRIPIPRIYRRATFFWKRTRFGYREVKVYCHEEDWTFVRQQVEHETLET